METEKKLLVVWLGCLVCAYFVPRSRAYLSMESSASGGGCDGYQFFHPPWNATQLPPPLIRSAFQKLEKTLETLNDGMSGNNVPASLSFGVVYDQELIYYKGTMMSSPPNARATDKPPTADSIYRIGSITKVWTVLMAFAMRDQRVIPSLDSTIHSVHQNFSIVNHWGITNQERKGHTLTIRQLASQVSGLAREVPCGRNGMVDCVGATTNEIFSRLSKEALIHPTDVRPSYSNLAYAILGNILSEYRGDETYNHTLFDLLLEPLGLTNTGMYLNTEQRQYAMTGYLSNGQPVPYIDIGWVGPAGNMFSSVRDLAGLMKQFFAAVPSQFETRGLNRTRSNNLSRYNFVLTPQSLREMLRPIFWNPDGMSAFGSPWEMRLLGKRLVRSKGGNIDGFSSSMAMIPEMKLGVVALTNHDGLDASLYTFSALQVLVPAFEQWMEEKRVTTFRAEKPTNYKDYLGSYTINQRPVFKVYTDEITTNLMVYSGLANVLGILQWQGGEDMVLYDLNGGTDPSCMSGAINAIDGVTLRFVRGSDGKVIGAKVIGLFDDVVLPKAASHRREFFIREAAFFEKGSEDESVSVAES